MGHYQCRSLTLTMDRSIAGLRDAPALGPPDSTPSRSRPFPADYRRLEASAATSDQAADKSPHEMLGPFAGAVKLGPWCTSRP
jgi:hypothetical protein